MKGKIVILALLIVSLFMVSCDRFDKPTKTENMIDQAVAEFFTEFSAVASTVTVDNIEDFMVFFHAEYLNNGETKQDVEAKISGFFLPAVPRFINVELVSNNNLNVIWKLIVTDEMREVVSTETIVDRMRKADEAYYLYGNQESGTVNENKMMPFAEIMTATWCGSCPNVEAVMHEYQLANPNNFFYLEFHTADAIAGDHPFFDNFYGLSTAPSAVLQGKDIFIGDHSGVYKNILDSYKEMDAELKLTNLVQTQSETDYVAQLEIEKLTTAEFNTDNLILRWAFYAEVSSVNNFAGEPCRNVVLTEGLYNITADDLNSTFSINHALPRDIPADMGIAFWLQNAGETYDDDSFVHAWIKQDVRSK